MFNAGKAGFENSSPVRLRVFAAVLLALALAACAPQEPVTQNFEIVQAEQRSITVRGHAELMVRPDVAVVTLNIVTLHRDLTIAEEENAAITAKVVGVMRHYNVGEKDIALELVHSYPESDSNSPNIRRYIVEQLMRVVVRDVTRLGNILPNAYIAGVNRPIDVRYLISDLQKYKDEVRLLAIQDAKARAQAMALQFEQSLGRPLSIQESGESEPPANGFPTSYVVNPYNNYYNYSASAVNFGQIALISDIQVSFEME
jgi:uncharacterized protein YggE